MLVEKNPAENTTDNHLPESIIELIEFLENNRRLKPAHIAQALREIYIPREDLLPWADFDHPKSDSYGRKQVYTGLNYEIMVMSWKPGDYSGIHDHGYTQYGAVKIYGHAEHAVFYLEGDRIHTLNRVNLESGTVIGVSHELIHQMGNPEKGAPFISLHVYACPEDRESITGDARLFDPDHCTIKRLDGGVFFDLSAEEVNATLPGPKGDFPTNLRYQLELLRRILKKEQPNTDPEILIERMIHPDSFAALRADLVDQTDHKGFSTSSAYWNVLNWELKETSALLDSLGDENGRNDAFKSYAEVYDAVVGMPCLQQFMAPYLQFLLEHYQIELHDKDVISIGCGTGLVEEYMIEHMGLNADRLLGIDLSASMVEVASKRINAKTGDVLTLSPEGNLWDFAYSGLNVFQYLGNDRMKEAIERTAAILKPGGYFIGDFITPDHIRNYPNVLYGASGEVISLRTPRLVEENGAIFQESEIINVDRLSGRMNIHYAGKHRRFLPPVHRVRSYFLEAFDGSVDLYDAQSLQPIHENADTCRCTRYVVVARQNEK